MVPTILALPGLLLSLLSAQVTVSPDQTTAEEAAPAGCQLWMPGSENRSAQDCLSCHDGSRAKAHLRTTHPVDLEYARAWSVNRQGLRTESEVVARGGFIPGGQVRCVSCHSAASPWAKKVVLPPGAKAKAAVNPFRPETYEGNASARSEPAPGSEVSPKPLCLVCHAYD